MSRVVAHVDGMTITTFPQPAFLAMIKGDITTLEWCATVRLQHGQMKLRHWKALAAA